MDRDSGYKILGFATQGASGDDENRLKALLSEVPATFYPFEKRKKYQNFWRLLQNILKEKPSLVVMEGTGIFGGLALIIGNLITGVPYVVSGGDAVGPFIAKKQPFLGPLFLFYEKLLYSRSIGFIGWTPYLAGRALSYGTKYAMTAAGWAPFQHSESERKAFRKQIREQYDIPEHHIVVGIVGSLNWSKRVGYCYGFELVQAAKRVKREDVTVIIVGDGGGKAKLQELAGEDLGHKIIFTGRVPREQVPMYLSAFDLASLPQSIDQVGAFRYTTKISEYLSVGLPILTGTLPMTYDLQGDWVYRIYGDTPWSETYIHSLANFMETITFEQIRQKSNNIPKSFSYFRKRTPGSSRPAVHIRRSK
ncbi:glycosyltransferase [Paenibacillus sp. P26]|nr:glycosyltransferase [Paenibacillus sp. P26]